MVKARDVDDLPPVPGEKRRLLRSLLSRRLRERRELALVEGERNLAEAARAGCLRFLAVKEGEPAEAARGLAARWQADLFAVDEATWSDVSDVVSSPGILGVAERPRAWDLRAAASGEGDVRLLFLDGVQDPGNVGGLIRSAWALGFTAALAGPGTADLFNPKTVRASAGGVFRLPLAPGAGAGDLRALLASGFILYRAETGGEDWERTRWAARTILALGNEGAGLSPEVRTLHGIAVSIPMRGGADSLNVLAAGSILMAAQVSSRRPRP
jgi:TrmH family RNA methyltransferase